MPRNRKICKNRISRVMCVKLKSDNDDKQYNHPVVEDFDFGTAIQELYPILSIIFKYLPAKDLENAAKVNNVWNEYSSKELSKRRQGGSFEICSVSGSLTLSKSSSFDNVNIGYGFLFGSAMLKRYHRISFHLDEKPVLDGLKMELTGPDIKMCGYLFESILPKQKRTVCSGLVLPKIPNLIIEEYNEINFVTNISKAIERGLQLKALIYFCDKRTAFPERFLKSSLKYFLDKREGQKLALGGGLITATMDDFFNNAHNKVKAVKRGFQSGIAFLLPNGENNFEGHSIIVEQVDYYQEKLAEAKANIALKKHCVAILFQCSGLSVPYLQEEFQWYFPTVEFKCVAVEGEIGLESYDANCDTNENLRKKCKCEPVFLHAYSIVIMFLCWD